jgi:putative intracellular protease/amidase
VARIAILLIDDFADWEAAHLAAAAREHFGDEVRWMSPGGRPVRSMGGLTAVPDLALETWTPDGDSAFVVVGSPNWEKPGSPDVSGPIRRARDAGLVVGAICGATLAAARAGLLDDRCHTSNDPAFLAANGGAYAGASGYVDTPAAVVDDRIVTAPGSAPTTFATAILRLLHPEAKDAFGAFEAMCAREFSA